MLDRVKEERNILHKLKRRKRNWIGHILLRNCLLKHIIEGKVEGRIRLMVQRGRRRKKLLDGLKDRIGNSRRTRAHYVRNSIWKRLWT